MCSVLPVYKDAKLRCIYYNQLNKALISIYVLTHKRRFRGGNFGPHFSNQSCAPDSMPVFCFLLFYCKV